MREMWNDDVHLLYAVDDTPVTTSRFHHVVLFHRTWTSSIISWSAEQSG